MQWESESCEALGPHMPLVLNFSLVVSGEGEVKASEEPQEDSSLAVNLVTFPSLWQPGLSHTPHCWGLSSLRPSLIPSEAAMD